MAEAGGAGIWVAASNGQVPPNAVEGGRDGNVPLFIARAKIAKDLVPGKLHPAHQTCYVPYGGRENSVKDYEVLCSASGKWIPYAPGAERNAIVGGRTKAEINTPDKLEYQFHPVSGALFKFKVRAAHDAHLALTPSPQASQPIYEVFIGGWNNSKSVIRRDGQKPDVVEIPTPGILNPNEFRGFWVRWYDNIIAVGREQDSEAFMVHNAPDLFPVNFVGICTGWGANGTWLLENHQSSAPPMAGYAQPSYGGAGGAGGAGIWVPASNGQVPPNAMQGGFDGDQPLFIARARHEGELIPGKLHPAHGVCYVSYGGGEHGHSDYEVLCSGNGQWVPIRDGIPPNAVPAGETKEGEPLFIGRANHEGTVTPGKVQASHSCCYIPYGGEELSFRECEVYVA